MSIFSKIKHWVVEEEYEEEVEEVVEEEDAEKNDINLISNQAKPSTNNANNKVVNLHGVNQMKGVIVEPKKYEDVTVIADHLKQKKAVIVNLENLNDPGIRKSIFEFMNGAVYVLDGGIQKVSKGIFILAPNNVDIDSSIKKELESKTLFPWQSK